MGGRFEWLRESELKHAAASCHARGDAVHRDRPRLEGWKAGARFTAVSWGFGAPGCPHYHRRSVPRSRRACHGAHTHGPHPSSRRSSSLQAHNVFVAKGAFAQIFFWLFLIASAVVLPIVEMLEETRPTAWRPRRTRRAARSNSARALGNGSGARRSAQRLERERVTRAGETWSRRL